MAAQFSIGPIPPLERLQQRDLALAEAMANDASGAPGNDRIGATSCVTTALAPMIAPLPTVTPGVICALAPIHTSLPIVGEGLYGAYFPN